MIVRCFIVSPDLYGYQPFNNTFKIIIGIKRNLNLPLVLLRLSNVYFGAKVPL